MDTPPELTPPVYVTQTQLPTLDDYVNLLEDVWQSRTVTNNGPLVRRLEVELATFLGVDHLVLVNNGTTALQLAIKEAGLSGSVVTTPYSYVATTTALIWEGLFPVFVDIDPATGCLNAEAIEAAIRPDTTAILATHVYGFPCDCDAIRRIADRYGLRVIYDGAHAFGVKFGGQSLLRRGDCTTLSFHATKVFHTIEGGAIVTGSEQRAERLRLLRSFGHVHDDYICMGLNGKMSELHAGIGLLNLPRHPEQTMSRARLYDYYAERLTSLEGLLTILRPPAKIVWNYAYLPVVFSSNAGRERAIRALADVGIYPRRYFGQPLNRLPYLPPPAQECPRAERLAERVLCLPFHAQLASAVIDRIVEVLQTLPLK